jgi:hypothetical protein
MDSECGFKCSLQPSRHSVNFVRDQASGPSERREACEGGNRRAFALAGSQSFGIGYNYWSQLVAELKQQDSVLFALAEDGMHPPNVLTTMEQLFDGVIEMRLYEEGLAITPLFRVKKMLGLPPLHGYFRFAVSSTGMEVTPHVH